MEYYDNNTPFSFEARESFSHAKNLEEQTKIQLLKCQNYFLEKDILEKLDKKKSGHYLSLIEKLKRFDDILQGFEMKNVDLQAVLMIKEEELAEIHEKYRGISEENEELKKRNLARNEEKEGENGVLKENWKKIQEEIEEMGKKLKKSEELNLKSNEENEVLRKNRKILQEKIEEMEQNLKKSEEKLVKESKEKSNEINQEKTENEVFREKQEKIEELEKKLIKSEELREKSHENSQLKEENEVLRKNRKNLLEKIEEIEENLKKSEEKLKETLLKNGEKSNEILQLKEKNNEKTQKSFVCSSEFSVIIAENEQFKSEKELLLQKLQKSEQELSEIKTISLTKISTFSSISDKINEKELDKLKKAHERVFLEKVAKEQENHALKQEKVALLNTFQSFEVQLAKFEAKNRVLITNLEEKESEIFQIIDKFQGEIAIKSKENEDLKRKNKEMTDFLKKTQISLNKAPQKKLSMDLIDEYEGSKTSQAYFDCEDSFTNILTPKLHRKTMENGEDDPTKLNNFMKEMKKLGII